MGRSVVFVPHVHWDREWYRPFESFRMALVALLDGLLPQLEADPSYSHFVLDGQMAAVDDYLAIRPEAAGRIRRLRVSGRLSVGPWYVLADEFCVSGETLVRDLQLGLEKAAAFGGAMAVGYLPDSFGHVAQMPQLLAQAGLEHAVVWRGVPTAVDRTAFRWSAPDSSTVRAEYLPVGYGNGAAVPDDAKLLLARVRAHEQELAALLTSEDALL
ncbi:MAG: alpha-mannosidase, partial [Actinomycetota bacterium]|nr:alpha-mannosidase [Actinomycetota bacterium]